MARFAGVAGLAVTVASVLGGCGGAAAPESARLNVLLISIDSLRADHLSCYGYERATSPAIDRLASQGILFENAVSSSSWTLPAHAAAFTALPDSIHRVERTNSRLGDGYRTLAEVLRDEGYRTAGFWSGPFLDPSFGLGQGFDDYVDCRTPFVLEGDQAVKQRVINDFSHEDVTSPRLVEEVAAWLSEHRAGPGKGDSQDPAPFFLFVHMWDVHYDYLPPAPFDTLFDPGYEGSVDGRNVEKTLTADVARDVEHVVALYDGEIAWTDDHVGQMLALLDQHGVAQETLVVVTADHGEEFFEHGKFGHRKTLFEESIRIPLVVRLPDGSRAGTREARAVSITDIAPTILALTGSPAFDQVMGEPLFGLEAAGNPPRAVALSQLRSNAVREIGNLLAVRGPDWKLLVRRQTGEPYRLYDLAADPGEQHDLLQVESPLRARALEEYAALEERLAALRERHLPGQTETSAEHELTGEMEAELRSLGYIGDEDSE